LLKRHVENAVVHAIPATPWRVAGFPAGAAVRVLSDDAESGALTGVIELPVGFSSAGAALACSADLQMFVLAGELRIGAARLTAGSYCFHPAGSATGDWECTSTVRALLIVGPHPGFAAIGPGAAGRGPDPRAIPAIDSWALQWIDPLTASDPSTPYRTGVMVKMLREDRETGSTTHLAGLLPGWFMPGLEVHPVTEENYCLSGDVHIGMVGDGPGYTMTEGVYLCRPPGIAHGPILSKNGNVNFCYTHGRLGIDYREDARSGALIRDHLRDYPWR
jgi:hypothetical protein